MNSEKEFTKGFDPTTLPGGWGNEDAEKGYQSYITRDESGGWQRFVRNVTSQDEKNFYFDHWEITTDSFTNLQESLSSSSQSPSSTS